jgi:hypothetical protein
MTTTRSSARSSGRLAAALALITLIALALSGTATAKTASRVTGGTSQLALSTSVQSALTAHHLTVTPLTPATASTGTFTLPISHGRLNTANRHGWIVTAGGLSISSGTETIGLRHLTTVSNAHGVSVFAVTRGPIRQRCRRIGRHHLRMHCVTTYRVRTARIATVSGLTVTGTTASGTLALTPVAARLVNDLAGATIATAGAPVGTVTMAPTLG